MNSQFFPELNERINREAHERLIKEAQAERRARKAVSWLRLLGAKKQEKARTIELQQVRRKKSATPAHELKG